MKLTSAQTKVINSISEGKELTSYRNNQRFVFNAGTEEGYTVNAKAVNALIACGLLTTKSFAHGNIVTLA